MGNAVWATTGSLVAATQGSLGAVGQECKATWMNSLRTPTPAGYSRRMLASRVVSASCCMREDAVPGNMVIDCHVAATMMRATCRALGCGSRTIMCSTQASRAHIDTTGAHLGNSGNKAPIEAHTWANAVHSASPSICANHTPARPAPLLQWHYKLQCGLQSEP